MNFDSFHEYEVTLIQRLKLSYKKSAEFKLRFSNSMHILNYFLKALILKSIGRIYFR